MNWVDCNDGMPDPKSLVYFYNGKVGAGKYCGDGLFISFSIAGNIKGVTHWMHYKIAGKYPEPPVIE